MFASQYFIFPYPFKFKTSMERSASYKSNGVSQLIIPSAILEILSVKVYKKGEITTNVKQRLFGVEYGHSVYGNWPSNFMPFPKWY